MSDALSLRSLLSRIDASAPAIQAAAGAMMKHYDKSASVAVVEWRNALHQARPDQQLALLYVANEVLQNSKRNRGNKFLEAFSPVLGQSLIFISSQSTTVVEKVRRTVKIWGDRHVFSIRYVNELLRGLEPYRGGENAHATKTRPASSNHVSNPTTTNGTGTSAATTSSTSSNRMSPQTESSSNSPLVVSDSGVASMDTDEPSANGISGDTDQDDDGINIDDASNGHDDDDEERDMFGDDGIKLDIKVDLDKAADAMKATSKRTSISGMKRRRPNDSSTSGEDGSNSTKTKRTILSTNSLMKLWNQIASLEQSYDHALTTVMGTKPETLEPNQIESLVGDELLDAYKNCLNYEQRIIDQRRELHRIAQKRRALEQEAMRYLPWLEGALKHDEEDIQFCDKLEQQLELFLYVHGPARNARDSRLREEELRRQEQEAFLTKKKEEEERKKFMESAMKKETEAKPGMVWNKALGEYVYLQTDESWRD